MQFIRRKAPSLLMAGALLAAPTLFAQVSPSTPTPEGCVKRGNIFYCSTIAGMLSLSPRRAGGSGADVLAMLPENASADQLYQAGARLNARRQYPQAAALFHRCALLNDPRCDTALGLAYFNAKGLNKDVTRAVDYVGRGALGNNRGAQYEMGYWYDEGEVFPHDAQKAFGWYIKSAQQDFATAQTRVSIAYEFGDGVARNRALAVVWLFKAAQQGDGFSQVLADTLKNPRTPAQFKDEDALADYLRSTQSAAIAASWPKVSHNKGYDSAQNLADAAARVNSAALGECRAGASC